MTLRRELPTVAPVDPHAGHAEGTRLRALVCSQLRSDAPGHVFRLGESAWTKVMSYSLIIGLGTDLAAPPPSPLPLLASWRWRQGWA